MRLRLMFVLAIAGFLCIGVLGSGTELRVSFPQHILSLDPQGSSAAERIVMILGRHIFDALVEMAPDTEVTPSLATSWEIPDPTTWIFHLRKGVTFHNGEPFNAAAVVASFDRLRALGTTIAPLFAPVEKVAVVDEYTVKFETDGPYAPLLKNLFFLKIVPPQASQGDDFSGNPVGTGPFKFVSWEPGVKVVLEANREYWRKGVPGVDRLTFVEIPEPTTAVTALLNGEVDLVAGVPPEQTSAISAAANFTAAQPEKTVQVKYLWMNCRGPLADPKVRTALWYAIDIPTIAETVFEGLGAVPTSMIGAGVFGYSPMPQIPYDPDLAKALLAEAGYPNGFATTLKFNAADLRVPELAEVIRAELSMIGINVKLIPQERAAWLDDFLAPKLDWDLTICNGGSLTGDPDYSLNRLLPCAANRTLCCNPELDYWLSLVRSSVDPDVRKEAVLRTIQMLWDGGGPWLPVVEQKLTYAWSNTLSGFEPPANELPDFSTIRVVE